MKTVGSFLERFKHLEAPERSVRVAVIETVKDVVGISVPSESIKVGLRGELHLSLSSSVKCAIFENKQNIISRINNILGKDQIKNIK